MNMRRRSRKRSTSPRSSSVGWWIRGGAVSVVALAGHVIVRSLITDVREGGLPLLARPTPGSLALSVQPPPTSAEQVLQKVYHQALVAGYYGTVLFLCLGLFVLVGGLYIGWRGR